jgi:hypothetical protein
MIWLIWCDARDDNAWNFGTPRKTLPWIFTISEDCARELLETVWDEVKPIVRSGKVAQVDIAIDQIYARDTTEPTLPRRIHVSTT